MDVEFDYLLLGKEGGREECSGLYLSLDDRLRLIYRFTAHIAYLGSKVV